MKIFSKTGPVNMYPHPSQWPILVVGIMACSSPKAPQRMEADYSFTDSTIQRWDHPVLVLTGEAGAGRPDKLMGCVPSARQVIIPDTGHVANLEQPEAFTGQVQKFISSVKPVAMTR
ncbi:MAG: alpha/beta hydrolase [Breznakibacter sp.]